MGVNTGSGLPPSARREIDRRLVHGVKYIEGEFYLRCASCWRAHRAAYWPLTTEFWWPRVGLTKCRACWQSYRRRVRERADRRAEARRYYADAHTVILIKKRQHYADNRDRILARRRELYAQRKALEAAA